MEERNEALARTTDIIPKYSDEMVKRWNEEIADLLVNVRKII